MRRSEEMQTHGLNIGSGPGWHKDGWVSIDHKRRLFGRGGTAWRTHFSGESFDLVFHSHVMEHIPHFKADIFLAECNRVLKPGGGIRIVCPDLARIARAYCNEDVAAMRELTADATIRSDLGHGGMFMGYVVSPGSDSLLFSRAGECIGGYAHLYCYDFAMLQILLERNGFADIRQCAFGQSRYPELTEPLHPVGTPPTWRLEGAWEAHDGITGFDRNPAASLIVEAVKTAPATFCAPEFGDTALGLDPFHFDWPSITRAYLQFSAAKLRRAMRGVIPRRLRRTLRAALFKT